MLNQPKLGRGLDALFNGGNNQNDKEAPNSLQIDKLFPNPNQPRREFNQDAMLELAESIKKQGIIQPLLVRPMPDGTYQIVAGERRWRAAKMAELKEVPVFVRELADNEVMAAALIENLQRADLNPIEEAHALKSLKEELKLTQETLAARLGKSRPAIANALRLLQLNEQAQNDLCHGLLSSGHARALLSIEDSTAAEELRQHIVAENLTVRESEEIANYWKKNKTFNWTQELPAKEEKKTKVSRKKSQAILDLQKTIATVLSCKANVSGTEEKGKITLSYRNHEELQALLLKLGATEVANNA